MSGSRKAVKILRGWWGLIGVGVTNGGLTSRPPEPDIAIGINMVTDRTTAVIIYYVATFEHVTSQKFN